MYIDEPYASEVTAVNTGQKKLDSKVVFTSPVSTEFCSCSLYA